MASSLIVKTCLLLLMAVWIQMRMTSKMQITDLEHTKLEAMADIILDPILHNGMNRWMRHFMLYSCPGGLIDGKRNESNPEIEDQFFEGEANSAAFVIKIIGEECTTRNKIVKLPINLRNELEVGVHTLQLKLSASKIQALYVTWMRSCGKIMDFTSHPEVVAALSFIEDKTKDPDDKLKEAAVKNILLLHESHCTKSTNKIQMVKKMIRDSLSTNFAHRYSYLLRNFLPEYCIVVPPKGQLYKDSKITYFKTSTDRRIPADDVFLFIRTACEIQLGRKMMQHEWKRLNELVHIAQYSKSPVRVGNLLENFMLIVCETRLDITTVPEINTHLFYYGVNKTDIDLKNRLRDAIVLRFKNDCGFT